MPGVKACPCGRGDPYDECCGRLHRGEAAAVTAEQLMRSRYSAFAAGEPDYLLATWHPSTRPDGLELDPARRWTFLEIVGTSRGGLLDDAGTVEFRAHYRQDGRSGAQHEVSRFTREDGRWLYLDGRTG
jgi:SEC-C motif domain protein